MAIFTRINGDAAGQINVDNGRALANATGINTGISAPMGAYKVFLPAATNGNLAAELQVGGAVETIIRTIEANATVLAYQVDQANVTYSNCSVISVLTERSGWSAADLQTYLQSLGSNIGAYSYVTTSNCQVSTSGGIKFA